MNRRKCCVCFDGFSAVDYFIWIHSIVEVALKTYVVLETEHHDNVNLRFCGTAAWIYLIFGSEVKIGNETI